MTNDSLWIMEMDTALDRVILQTAKRLILIKRKCNTKNRYMSMHDYLES